MCQQPKQKIGQIKVSSEGEGDGTTKLYANKIGKKRQERQQGASNKRLETNLQNLRQFDERETRSWCASLRSAMLVVPRPGVALKPRQKTTEHGNDHKCHLRLPPKWNDSQKCQLLFLQLRITLCLPASLAKTNEQWRCPEGEPPLPHSMWYVASATRHLPHDICPHTHTYTYISEAQHDEDDSRMAATEIFIKKHPVCR